MYSPKLNYFCFWGILLFRIFTFLLFLGNKLLLSICGRFARNWHYGIDNGSSKESFYNDNGEFKTDSPLFTHYIGS